MPRVAWQNGNTFAQSFCSDASRKRRRAGFNRLPLYSCRGGSLTKTLLFTRTLDASPDRQIFVQRMQQDRDLSAPPGVGLRPLAARQPRRRRGKARWARESCSIRRHAHCPAKDFHGCCGQCEMGPNAICSRHALRNLACPRLPARESDDGREIERAVTLLGESFVELRGTRA